MANTGLNTFLPKLTVTASEYNYSMQNAEIPALMVSGSATSGTLGEGVFEIPCLKLTATSLGIHGTAEVELPSITATVKSAEKGRLEIPLLEVTASGKTNIIGKAEISIPQVSVTGKNGLNVTIEIPLAGVTAHGLIGMIGRGDIKLPVFNLTASGHTPIIATASISLPRLALMASGGQRSFATASISIPMIKVSPHGYVGSVASASITLPVLELDGSGYLNLSGTASITLPLLEVTANVPESIILVDIDGNSEPLTGYALVLNLRNNGLTEYDNYNFNSFCHFNGRYLGANSTGIFNLTGSTDNETKIRAKARTGLQDGKTALRKGIEDAFFGVSADDTLTAKVVTDGYSTYQGSAIAPRTDSAVTQRVKFGKGIRSRYLGIEIENNNGCDFTLESAELVVVPLTRKL